MLKELAENKLLWVALVICVLLVGAVSCGPYLMDRMADRVIERLLKEYSPGPYSPGFDPDKVDPNAWHHRSLQPEQANQSSSRWEDQSPKDWNRQWEDQRH